MWWYISTEASYQLNFNVSFSTTRSDVLIHLSQWQYWWWFWFAFLWSFYYILLSRIVRFRTLKMKPKIVTSYRPHGKWGDFLAAIIPAIWCINILTNSNFILRLMEWQSESSLFVVRVRARQWYWIYKFEMKNLIDIISTPKNVGRNKWFFSNFGDLQYSDSYMHLLQLRFKSRLVKNHWMGVLSKISQNDQNNVLGLRESPSQSYNLLNTEDKQNMFVDNFYFFNTKLNKTSWLTKVSESSSLFNINQQSKLLLDNFNILENFKTNLNINSNLFSYLLNNFEQKNSDVYYPDVDSSSRIVKRGLGVNLPIRLIKYPLILNGEGNLSDNKNLDLFKVLFNSGKSELKVKPLNDVFFYTIKQNKYKRRTSIPISYKYERNFLNEKTNKISYQGRVTLLNNSLFNDYLGNSEDVYNLMKKNKKNNELIPVTLAKRMLRTKRTLVLPAHVNITIITNSFDVVHSWFIPGLGVKLDCVPGRSTHHTLYIDNVGFYYGQCAEVCGRYHHHMPIRVCALPFEHFLLWWNVFGLPRILFTNNQHRFQSNYGFRKFLW